MYRQIIMSKLVEYLRAKKIPLRKGGAVTNVRCPFCKYDEKGWSVHITFPIKDKGYCLHCKKRFTIIDVARILEPDLTDATEEIILHRLKEVLGIKAMTKTDEKNILQILELYQKYGFDLVPIIPNDKIPNEKDWTRKSHKDVDEWYQWVKDGLNIGVKTGKISNVTIIDIDQKPIPEEVKAKMGEPLIQESSKGFHLVYQYEPELRKTRIDEMKIDIENDGGQVVFYPSMVKNVRRKLISTPETLPKMPTELKELLLSKITVSRKTHSELIREDIETENFKIKPEDFKLKNEGLDGCCNSSFIKLGGILRKELNSQQTGYVLHTLNKHLLEDPMKSNAITAMVRELDRYISFDEQELAHKVLEYLKKIEEANRTEIAMAVANTNRGEEKKRVDLALQYLVKEGLVLKKGRSYSVIQKADWKETLIETGKPIDFKLPYFYDVGNFNYGDLVLIGSKNKKGKTHISMNIVKQLVEQGIKPYYISLETGSRFAKIAMQLGLKEGDFKWTFCSDPTQIELEPNSVTIIDWLLIIDKSKTDLVFRHFVEQLYKSHGLLIVFQQLKQNNEYFAPNMAMQFPALSTRYLYDSEDDGEFGKFKIDVIREPKLKIKTYEIPCQYDWETKELKRVDEVQAEKPPEEEQNG